MTIDTKKIDEFDYDKNDLYVPLSGNALTPEDAQGLMNKFRASNRNKPVGFEFEGYFCRKLKFDNRGKKYFMTLKIVNCNIPTYEASFKAAKMSMPDYLSHPIFKALLENDSKHVRFVINIVACDDPDHLTIVNCEHRTPSVAIKNAVGAFVYHDEVFLK
jgi:hypothetical protein